MKLDFRGLDELIQEYDRMAQTIDSKAKDEALREGGDILLEAMQEEVYAHELTERSGEARESLTRTEPENCVVFVGTEGGKKQPGFYLYMHEHGYFNVIADRFIEPKPFASIAYEKSVDKILDAYVKVLRRELRM
ncbi:hypothetical protein [Alkalibacillus salilacus]|uniref:HK97 gp10 family phage protein n=1 Tax=Alkalibacillus salilacus TaxID=284582 RepID=A0ABT9VDB2_9BACI|nr:hypothetical protein [Alkalibacillus salilacus]MDQ0158962.1 HK97 gp10 family phage protein [Alkalibacillus salilacus]